MRDPRASAARRQEAPTPTTMLVLAALALSLALPVVWSWGGQYSTDELVRVTERTTGEHAGVVWSWGGQYSTDELVRVTERTTGEHAGTEDLCATGDFDGDGLPDEAYFAKSNGEYQLVISMSGEPAPVLVDIGSDVISRTGVKTQPPGKYTAYCADRFALRGRSDCGEDVLRELVATHDAVMLFTYESAAALLYWENGRLRTLYWVD